jgi:predicted RNA-binding Zn-ribbon protein involved in translation (DUF1610 family)
MPVLWNRGLDVKTPRLEVDTIVRHVCPYCPAGHVRRLAVRDLNYPYAWRPCGYACDTCYGLWIEKGTGVKLP